MASVIQASAGSTVNYRFRSGKEYLLCHESSFLVLPDGKTLVAPLYNSQNYTWKTLYAEDITTGKASQIGTHPNNITTVLYDEASKTLFAGDSSGHLIQYQKDSASFSQLKNYGDLGLGCLRSSTLVKNLAIFGGSKKCVVAIDTKTKEVVSGPVTTAFTYVYTLTPCEVSGSRTLLSVGGATVNYSDTRTDIFQLCFGDNEDEDKKNEDQVEKKKQNPPTTTTTTTKSFSTQTPPPLNPKATTFPGVPSTNLVTPIICSLQGYVKGLFSDFTKVYWDRLEELQRKVSV